MGAEVCTGALINLMNYGELAIDKDHEIINILKRAFYFPVTSVPARLNIETILEMLDQVMPWILLFSRFATIIKCAQKSHVFISTIKSTGDADISMGISVAVRAWQPHYIKKKSKCVI